MTIGQSQLASTSEVSDKKQPDRPEASWPPDPWRIPRTLAPPPHTAAAITSFTRIGRRIVLGPFAAIGSARLGVANRLQAAASTSRCSRLTRSKRPRSRSSRSRPPRSKPTRSKRRRPGGAVPGRPVPGRAVPQRPVPGGAVEAAPFHKAPFQAAPLHV